MIRPFIVSNSAIKKIVIIGSTTHVYYEVIIFVILVKVVCNILD